MWRAHAQPARALPPAESRSESLTLGGLAVSDDPGVLVHDGGGVINVYGSPASRAGMLTSECWVLG